MGEVKSTLPETTVADQQLKVVNGVGVSSVKSLVGELPTATDTLTERETALLELDDELFYKQMSYFQNSDLLNNPLLDEPELEILKEPEIFSEDLEELILALNPAVAKAKYLVDQRRNEDTTRLLRVLRNCVATQVFKQSYDQDESIWNDIAQRIIAQ